MEKKISYEEEEEDLQVKSRNFKHNDQLLVRLGSAEMPPAMQDHALRCTASLLHLHHMTTSPKPSLLARALKKEFDSVYGPAWHCIVGKSFGSFVTHSPGGFFYFSLDNPHNLSFLLFKTEVQLLTPMNQ